MAKYIINQTSITGGEISISGSKNSALPIIAGSILCTSPVKISNIPNLSDIFNMYEILNYLGCEINTKSDGTAIIYMNSPKNMLVPYELAHKFRASFLVMGALLSRFKKAEIALPGGCPIGNRPIDLHLKGFSAMGAEITQEHGIIEAKCDRLKGAKIYLDFPSVGATENLIIAASCAEGKTIIENAAAEPEISDLANFLNACGADIKNGGTSTVTINGTKELKGCEHNIIPDRIEAGTFMTAAAMCKIPLTIKNVIPKHLKPITAKFREMGIEIEEHKNYIKILRPGNISAADVKTLPFPGFPTDMQAQITSLLSITHGTSMVVETIFENRFLHIPELNRMGANIKIDGRCAIIEGTNRLTGTKVTATDLRAGAALTLAGLIADGTTEISDIEHIERGYENFVDKLNQIGADVSITND